MIKTNDCLFLIRKQTSEALKNLIDLKTQAKLWATQTRLTGQTEVKILLSKVDSFSEQMDIAEKICLKHQNHIKSLELEKHQMLGQFVKMDSEKSKYQAKIAELNSSVSTAQDQVEALSNQIKVIIMSHFNVIGILINSCFKQSMVLRSELLSVMSESKSYQDDAEAKAKQIAWLEQQLSQAQEQVSTTRKEVTQLRVDQGGMVHRSELEAMQAEFTKLDCSWKVESKRQRELFQALNEKFSVVDSERAELVNKMKVCAYDVGSGYAGL